MRLIIEKIKLALFKRTEVVQQKKNHASWEAKGYRNEPSDAKFHSLTAGGMRLWNTEFTKEQAERNGHLLYQLYADKMEEITRKVAESNL